MEELEADDNANSAVLWLDYLGVSALFTGDAPFETEELLSQRSNVPLVYSLTDLKASVALACGSRIKDINEWPILEFETMRRAIDRNKKYLICGIGSTNGCSWDGGNPYPSWCFDRNNDNRTTALISQARFGKSKK